MLGRFSLMLGKFPLKRATQRVTWSFILVVIAGENSRVVALDELFWRHKSTWTIILTWRLLGLRATRQPLGGYIVAPLYFCDNIVATRRDREAKLCTHFWIPSRGCVQIWCRSHLKWRHSDGRSQVIDLRLPVSSRYIRYVRPNIKDLALVRH